MEIKTYGLDDLEAARALQREAVRLHLPCPPVVSWEAKVVDADGVMSDHRMGKCNSYTRNGLNIIAKNSMPLPGSLFLPSGFGDGIMNVKLVSGNIKNERSYGFTYNTATAYLRFGTGTTESLEDFNLTSVLTPTEASCSITATFDTSARTLVSLASGVAGNETGSVLNIYEVGLFQSIFFEGSYVFALTVHDTIEPITVPAGTTLNWVYRFELAYPNP